MITTLVSFDGTAFSPNYEVGFVPGSEPRLAPAQVAFLERVGAWPVIVALTRNPQRVAVIVRIVGSDANALRAALFRLFDPEDETPKKLLGLNAAGVQMYVYAVCEELRVYGDQQHDTAFVATLAIDGDVRWRAETSTSDEWEITASGQTRVIANSGETDAYPVISIMPTSGKLGGYDYKRWCRVVWRGSNAASAYPVRMGPLDTDALVTAGDMQADGDDLRVLVDGTEVTRHLVAMNDANTYIWFSADYQPAPALELAASLLGTGSVDSIQLDDAVEMARLPSSGHVVIDNEVFWYTARDLLNTRLTGVSRAAWATAAAAHSAGAAVYWLQHEVLIVYGNATATAPAAAPATQPVFTLATSGNTSWVYDVFGDAAYPSRPGRWDHWGAIRVGGGNTEQRGGVYTATERTLSATTYSVAGAWLGELQGEAYGWNLYNPCGIVNAAWTGGKKRAVDVTRFVCELRYWVRGASFWSDQAVLAAPSTANTWEAWTQSAGSAWAAADRLAIAAYFYAQDVEAGACTVTLNSAETPLTTIGSEEGNYSLTATITNQTTGEALSVEFSMELDETLEIDTDTHTVRYLADGSNQFQAVSLDSARRAWLRLIPGNNTLRFDDTGTAGVTLTTEFERRHY